MTFVAWAAVLACAGQSAEPWRPAERPRADADGFVRIAGGTFRSGSGGLGRVEEFELLDHPVTNAEYARFVEAAGHPAPFHWEGGRVPAGFEHHPVVYVNRYDADAYCRWRTRAEGRVYRLPTEAEFEYAARGGLDRAAYPWGNDDPAGRAAFTPAGEERRFDAWKEYLKPVRSFAPNGYGLYDMAGNVWQMVLTRPDPATARFKYRIDSPADLETRVMGGSWARPASALRCGSGGSASPGLRQPDLGFRVAREPRPGAPNFRERVRNLVALAVEPGKVVLSWSLLPEDPPGVGFNVYRARRRSEEGFRRNAEPVRGATAFEDGDVEGGGTWSYRVRPVGPDGTEGPSSEWASPGPAVRSIAVPPRPTGGVPGFGDLDGDGLPDVVVRLDNGCTEMSQDPGVPVELEAYTGYGRFLWRRPLLRHEHCFGSANNAPVNVYDLDGDGRAEVIARVEEGGRPCLGVLDGLSGKLLRAVPWPEMLTDFAKSSTRIHMAVAYLDGKSPAIVTQTGLYENEVFTAYDAALRRLWEFRSVGPTNGSGSHRIEVADVDGDGRDEVFDGTTCLHPDGTVRWSIYREHPDIVAIRDFLPERPGLEVFYAVESSRHAGAYLVDASTGKILWKMNREDDSRWTHAHHGWVADVWEGSPGIECFTNRDGHPGRETVLFSASGKVLFEGLAVSWKPVEWDGAPGRELVSPDGREVGRFDGARVAPLPAGPALGELGRARVVMVADLWGDFRDEIVLAGAGPDGRFAVHVVTNAAPAASRRVTPRADRHYRLWLARNLIGGYGTYFEPAR